MVELTSGRLSIVILAVAIVSVVLYFLGISWAGLYVTFFLITAVINCAAQAYWTWTSRETDEGEGDGGDNSDDEEGQAPQAPKKSKNHPKHGGAPGDTRPVNGTPAAEEQAYYTAKTAQSIAQLASQTPEVHRRTSPAYDADNFTDLSR
jgi:hypothetical protein